MTKELDEKEFASIRDEVLKWQDRRIIFSQVALTIVTAYTGFLIADRKDHPMNLSWQIASIFPLLIISITMHINRIFELFQIRGAAYLAVFYNSRWENLVKDVSLSEGQFKVGYNKSMAFVYLFIAGTSSYIFISTYPYPFFSVPTIVFFIFVVIFTIIWFRSFLFSTNKERKRMRNQWEVLVHPGAWRWVRKLKL